MAELYAQGDILIERVPDVPMPEVVAGPSAGEGVCLAEGELSGHRHMLWDNVTFFRDDAMARDVPASLYIGHVKVEGAEARLTHDEHATITLPPGTYRVRRQREIGPRDARLVAD
jgi:hypothetical protein